jgi:hypothetical protein
MAGANDRADPIASLHKATESRLSQYAAPLLLREKASQNI